MKHAKRILALLMAALLLLVLLPVAALAEGEPAPAGEPASVSDPNDKGDPDAQGDPDTQGDPDDKGDPDNQGDPDPKGDPDAKGDPDTQGDPDSQGDPDPEEGDEDQAPLTRGGELTGDGETTYTVTLSTSPEGSGRVTGAGTYPDGETVTISASANGGYRFVHWTSRDGNINDDAMFSFPIHENRTYEAVFVEDPTNVSSYTLEMPESVTISPNAATTGFTVNVSALDLRPNASGNTPESFRVKINAATLVNQSDSDKTISFKLCPENSTLGTTEAIYLRFNKAQSKPGYIVITSSQWEAATPGVYAGTMSYQTYYQYSNGDPEWLETGSISITLTIPASATVYAVTVNNGSGGGEYAAGASVTITANEPESGQRFKAWTGAEELTFTEGSAATSPATFTMPANAVTLTATYEDAPPNTSAVNIKVWPTGHTFSIAAEPGDSVENVKAKIQDKTGFPPERQLLYYRNVKLIDGTLLSDYGYDYTDFVILYELVTVTYKVVGGTWADGTTKDQTEDVANGDSPHNVPTGMIASPDFTGGAWDTDPITATISGDTTFTYTFEAVPTCTVTVNNGTGGGEYAEGASVTITANEPEAGKQFKAWTGAEGLTFTDGSASTSPATFTMPARAVELTATYEEIPATGTYTVKFDPNVPANASTTCAGSMADQSFGCGEKKALSANDFYLPGYDFTGWDTKADGSGTHYDDEAEVEGLTDDGGTVTLYAQWSAKVYMIIYFESDEPGARTHTQTAYFDQPGKLLVYSDATFGWDSSGKTLRGWTGAGLGLGSFYEEGEDFCNLCGAPNPDGSLTNVTLTADWVWSGQIVVTITKDGVPQGGLEDGLVLIQGTTVFKVPISYVNGKYVFDTSTAAAAPVGQPDPLPAGVYTLQFNAEGYPLASEVITYGENHPVGVVFDYYTVSLTKDPTYADFNEVEISGGEPVPGESNTVVALDGDDLQIKTTCETGYRFLRYTAAGIAPVWADGDPTKAEQTIQVRGQADITAHIEPIPYAVTVNNGTADKTIATVGETVTITAGEPEAGQRFKTWTTEDGVTFADAASAETTFTMPAQAVTVTATYEDIPTYTVTGGADSSWRKDSGKSLVLTVKRSVDDETCFDHFTGVEIDGKAVTAYTAQRGSTVITLKPGALNGLKTGYHTIAALFDDGRAEARVKILAAHDDATGTGDERRPNLWLGLMGFSALGLGALLALERRRQRKGR